MGMWPSVFLHVAVSLHDIKYQMHVSTSAVAMCAHANFIYVVSSSNIELQHVIQALYCTCMCGVLLNTAISVQPHPRVYNYVLIMESAVN